MFPCFLTAFCCPVLEISASEIIVRRLQPLLVSRLPCYFACAMFHSVKFLILIFFLFRSSLHSDHFVRDVTQVTHSFLSRSVSTSVCCDLLVQ
jgi:hypothetical protein